MKATRAVLGIFLAVMGAGASAGVMTVYENPGTLVVTTNSNNVIAQQTLANPITNGLLVDFNVRFAGVIDANNFLGLWFGYDQAGTANDKNVADAHTAGPNIGIKTQVGGGSDLFVRNTGTDASFLTGGNITPGETYRIFGHLYKSTGSATYNRFDAWVNPTALELATWAGQDARSTLESGIGAINAFGFRSANLASDSIQVSGLRIQAIPEPGVLALTVLGLAGLVRTRRRRMN